MHTHLRVVSRSLELGKDVGKGLKGRVFDIQLLNHVLDMITHKVYRALSFHGDVPIRGGAIGFLCAGYPASVTTPASDTRMRPTGVVWSEAAAAFFCFALARRSWFLDLMAFVFASEVAVIPFTAMGIVVSNKAWSLL